MSHPPIARSLPIISRTLGLYWCCEPLSPYPKLANHLLASNSTRAVAPRLTSNEESLYFIAPALSAKVAVRSLFRNPQYALCPQKPRFALSARRPLSQFISQFPPFRMLRTRCAAKKAFFASRGSPLGCLRIENYSMRSTAHERYATKRAIALLFCPCCDQRVLPTYEQIHLRTRSLYDGRGRLAPSACVTMLVYRNENANRCATR